MLSPRLLLPGLRGHLAKPLRSALMVFGIALGAALCTFIVLINTATLKSLEHSINDLAGETDLTVSALGGESFSEDVFDRVLKIPGVKNAVPLIQNKAFIYLKDGSQTAMTLLGIDLLNDSSVRSPEKTDSRLVTDPLAFMASSDSIALTQVFAKQHRLALQDTVQVVTALGVKRFTIRALIDESGPGKAFGGTLAVMDIEASRVAYGKSGKMDQVNIIVEDRDQLKQTLSRIQDTLGDSFSVEPPSSQLQSLRDVIAPFQKILVFLGGLSFLMAFFLIYNTASVSLAERRTQIGILRALGMERARVLTLILTEYCVLGLVGSALGSMVAWLTTKTFIDSIQKGFSSQTQAVVPVAGSMIDFRVVIVVTILGMLTTVVAVFYPVWKLSRVSPAEAIGAQKSLQSGTARAGRWRPVLFSISALLLLPVFPPFYGYHRLLNLAPIVGAIVLAPMLAAALLKYSRRAARLFPLAILQLAWGYAVDKPGRIESTIRGVVVGMLLIFVIASIQDGFMQALSSMFINSSRPDFYVSSNGDFISPMTLQPIDDRLQLELAKVAGVAGVFGQRIVNVQYESHKIKMSAFDEVPPSTLATPYSYFEVVDRPTALAGHEMYHSAAPSVMVSESFQSLYGKKTGDAISLRVLNRSIEFRIVGIVRDFTAGGGRIYIARNLYKSLWHDPLVTGIAIVLEKSALLGAVKAAIEERFGRSHGLVVTIDRGIKKDVEGILRQSFLSFYFIEFVCILVAVLGFVSAFLIEIQSRTVELATLRAIGMSRFELSLFLSTEAFLLGLGASLVTLVLAVPVSWGLISHTLPLVLGWVVEYHFAWRIWLLTFLLGIFIAVVSSLVAIRWARGLSLAEAGAGE